MPPIKTEVTEQEGLGQYWEQLFRNAEELISFISEETDPFVFNLMNRHFDELEPMEGKDHGETMVYLVGMFVDRTTTAGSPTTTRDAIIFLARSRWDLETATQKFHNADEGFAMEEASDGDGKESSSGLSDPPPETGDEPVPGLEPEASSDSGSEGGEVEDTKEARKKRRQRTNRRLNPNIDRRNVVKGRAQPEKLTVSIVVPKKSGTVTKVSHFLKFSKGRNLEWTNGEHVRLLNKWREQLFLRRLGPSRPPRTPYHAAERRWLVNRHLQYQRDTEARAGRVEDWRTFPWHVITQEFNAQFAGKIIDGAPRPPRTKMSLRDEKGRIKELTDLTGTEPKKAPAMLAGMGAKEAAEAEREGGDGMESSEEEGPLVKKKRDEGEDGDEGGEEQDL